MPNPLLAARLPQNLTTPLADRPRFSGELTHPTYKVPASFQLPKIQLAFFYSLNLHVPFLEENYEPSDY